MKAPFGQTGVGTPFIVMAASPFPTDPKMKFESFAGITAPGVGYTTLIATGWATCGTAGRPGFAGGNGAGAVGTGTVVTGFGGAPAGPRGAHATNAAKTIERITER
jgi:hypothetical protein